MKLILTSILALASITAVAQTPATPPAATPATAPAITPAEQFTLNQYDQKIDPLWNQILALKQERDAYVKAMNAGHPGWQWHDATSPEETSGYVPLHVSPGTPPAQRAPAARTGPKTNPPAATPAPAAK